MGSNVPPMIPTRPPATERAYPGAPEPAPSGPTPAGVAPGPRPAGRGPMDRLDRLPRAAGHGPASRRCGDPDGAVVSPAPSCSNGRTAVQLRGGAEIAREISGRPAKGRHGVLSTRGRTDKPPCRHGYGPSRTAWTGRFRGW